MSFTEKYEKSPDKIFFFFQLKNTDIFLISAQKHMLWVTH